MFKTKVLFSRQQTRGVTAALLMALLLADGTTASSNEKVDAIQTPCDEGEWLEAVRKHYRQVEINLIARANDMSKEQRMLTLTAAKSAPGVKSILADVLAAVAGQRAAAVLGQLRQNQKTLGSTVALLAQRQGNIAALQRMRTIQKATFSESAAKSHSTNKYFATGTGECEARAALAAQPKTSCTITTASKGKLSAAAADLEKITKVKMTATGDFAFPDLKVEVEHKGTPAGRNDQHNGKAGCGDQGDAGSVGHGVAFTSAVLHKETLQPADIKLLDGNNCVAANKNSDHFVTTAEAIANAICTLKRGPMPTQKPLQAETVDDLVSDTEMQTILLTATADVTTIKQDAGERKKKVQQILGGAGKQLKDVFFAGVEDRNMKFTLGEATVETSVKEAAETEKYALTLAYFSGEAAKRAEKATKATPQNQVKEEECTGEEKDYCNKKLGCKYNDRESKCENTLHKQQQQKQAQTQTPQEAILL